MAGLFRTSQINHDEAIISSYVGREAIVSATVLDLSKDTNNQVRLQIGDIQFNNSTKQLKCQAYAVLAGEEPSLSRSDRVKMRARIRAGFGDYSFSISRPVILGSSKPDPPDYFAAIHSFAVARLHESISSPAVDLALGFLVGEKPLSAELKEQLKIVGLSHIVVASGFSLSVLVSAARK